MYDLAREKELNLEVLRARLQRMSERELLGFGRAARLDVLASHVELEYFCGMLRNWIRLDWCRPIKGV